MYYFIINPRSRSGYGGVIWDMVQQELEHCGVPYEAYFTLYKKHAARLAHELEGRHPVCTIIVLGGDGTVNEVLNGFNHPANITLGYIPTGSGNDFARGMGIPTKPIEALRLILSEHTTVKMDLGTLKTTYHTRNFGVSAGIGFDAAICHEALASPMKDTLNHLGLGKLTYVGIALKQILLFKPCKAHICLDGKRTLHFPRLYFAAIMNQKYEGGGFRFAPEAKSDDRLLHICVVGNLSKPKILFMLPTAYPGKHVHLRGIHMLTCRQIEIHTDRPLPVHSDGESCGYADSISLSIAPEQISVILPGQDSSPPIQHYNRERSK
jgi:YegS/Rv2252/BmrU family lipid kinase